MSEDFILFQDKKGNDMGAIIMSVLVSVIAIVGVIYFNHQDKKTKGQIPNF